MNEVVERLAREVGAEEDWYSLREPKFLFTEKQIEKLCALVAEECAETTYYLNLEKISPVSKDLVILFLNEAREAIYSKFPMPEKPDV